MTSKLTNEDQTWYEAELHFADQRYAELCAVMFELMMQGKINFHEISKVNDVTALAQTIIEAGITRVESKHLNLTDEEFQQAVERYNERKSNPGLKPKLNIVEELRKKTK